MNPGTQVRQAVSVNPPGYQRIADDLRRAIIDGELPPGAEAARPARLAAPTGVSDRVAVEGVRLLVAEGFVDAPSGAGSYVRERPDVSGSPVLVHDAAGGSPFPRAWPRWASPAPGNHSVERTADDPGHRRPARRRAGPAAMCTRYTFLGGGDPVMLSISWDRPR